MNKNFSFGPAAALIAIIFIVVSCKKDGHANGTVTNTFNGEPVSGVTVNLIEHDLSNKHPGQKTLCSAQTDDNGEYDMSYTWKNKRNMKYSLSIDPQTFVLSDTTSTESRVFYTGPLVVSETSTTTESNKGKGLFKIAPSARIKIVPQFLSPPGPDDSFSVECKGPGPSEMIFEMKGQTLPVLNYRLLPCNNNAVSISIRTKKNGVEQTRNEIVAVKPFMKVIYYVSL